jgi:uncharacterized membrane protein
MTAHTNVATVERWASALGGAALAAYGLQRRSVGGAVIAAGAGALIYRGATGHWPMDTAAGLDPARSDTRQALTGHRGVVVEVSVTISRLPHQLYEFWRDFDHLPLFMTHLVAVESLGPQRSRWVVKAPAGRTLEWEAEVINDIRDELIGWRTLARADVVSAGSVRFQPAGAERGTEVHVKLQYHPPGGKLGAAIAWMLGHEPSQTVREDLRRLKQLMEAGEAPTIEGQPRGAGARW